jgi:DNA polymerase-3 subunit alpha
LGRHLAVDITGRMPPVAELVRTWPARRVETEAGTLPQGLPVRLHLHRPTAIATIDLGDQARFWPTDEALQRWSVVADGGRAEIVYESA